jgi:hypothetical protein
MSTSYRSPRINRSYLSRIVQEGSGGSQLAPDIFTERQTMTQGLGETRPPAHPKQAPLRTRGELSIIESRHPEIAKAISLLWGFPEMNEYFSRLWLADGTHGPIDPDAMSELMLLARLHQAVLPHFPGRSLAAIYGSDRLYEPAEASRDPWAEVPPRR